MKEGCFKDAVSLLASRVNGIVAKCDSSRNVNATYPPSCSKPARDRVTCYIYGSQGAKGKEKRTALFPSPKCTYISSYHQHINTISVGSRLCLWSAASSPTRRMSQRGQRGILEKHLVAGVWRAHLYWIAPLNKRPPDPAGGVEPWDNGRVLLLLLLCSCPELLPLL